MSPSHSRLSPPTLSDDDVVAVFLRIPPDDPARLIRASLVCKDWRRILTSPDFCRLYREFHAAPPMLGFFFCYSSQSREYRSRFIPTTAFRLKADPDFGPGYWKAADSHHGRILFQLEEYGGVVPSGYFVWDPITNGRWGVPSPGIVSRSYTAAVLCAKEHCDHLGCHGQPFLVATVFHSLRHMSACVYSSESGVWSDIITLDYWGDVDFTGNSVFVRNTLHVPLVVESGTNVLQYNLGEQTLSVIELPCRKWDEDDVPSEFISAEDDVPSEFISAEDDVPSEFIWAEDDVLVFAGMDSRGTRLNLWSTKAGALAWAKHTVIDLEKLLPPRAFEPKHHEREHEYKPNIRGFAEGVVFLATMAGLFTVELNSGRTKKVADVQWAYNITPWISFYTPDRARRIMPQP